jgi:hypothetical protein
LLVNSLFTHCGRHSLPIISHMRSFYLAAFEIGKTCCTIIFFLKDICALAELAAVTVDSMVLKTIGWKKARNMQLVNARRIEQGKLRKRLQCN